MAAPAHDHDLYQPAGRYEWERIVRRIVMPDRVKLLALILATYADADGTRVRPGNDVLAGVTGKGESTVRRILATLRTEYGLIYQVHRGGGRGGSGRATEYRLVIPADLLDRAELIDPSERRLTAHSSERSIPESDPVDNPETPLTLVSGQSDADPVDNPETPLTLVSGQSDADPVDNSTNSAHLGERSIAEEGEIDRSNNDVSERLTAHSERLTAHLGERLPPTYTTHLDHPVGPDPAQPQTARESTTPQDQSAPSDRASPPRCGHGLPEGRRKDGKPTCVLCRRALQEST